MSSTSTLVIQCQIVIVNVECRIVRLYTTLAVVACAPVYTTQNAKQKLFLRYCLNPSLPLNFIIASSIVSSLWVLYWDSNWAEIRSKPWRYQGGLGGFLRQSSWFLQKGLIIQHKCVYLKLLKLLIGIIAQEHIVATEKHSDCLTPKW